MRSNVKTLNELKLIVNESTINLQIKHAITQIAMIVRISSYHGISIVMRNKIYVITRLVDDNVHSFSWSFLSYD